jgi:hypothetical protein
MLRVTMASSPDGSPYLKMKHAFLLPIAILSICVGSAAPNETVSVKASSIMGTWLLNGTVKAVRFELKPNGTFKHRGYGSNSSGTWNVEGNHIRLRWTQIDTMKVDARKVTCLYPVESGSIKIGKFEYRKGADATALTPNP